jgi:hypothetical protein
MKANTRLVLFALIYSLYNVCSAQESVVSDEISSFLKLHNRNSENAIIFIDTKQVCAKCNLIREAIISNLEKSTKVNIYRFQLKTRMLYDTFPFTVVNGDTVFYISHEFASKNGFLFSGSPWLIISNENKIIKKGEIGLTQERIDSAIATIKQVCGVASPSLKYLDSLKLIELSEPLIEKPIYGGIVNDTLLLIADSENEAFTIFSTNSGNSICKVLQDYDQLKGMLKQGEKGIEQSMANGLYPRNRIQGACFLSDRIVRIAGSLSFIRERIEKEDTVDVLIQKPYFIDYDLIQRKWMNPIDVHSRWPEDKFVEFHFCYMKGNNIYINSPFQDKNGYIPDDYDSLAASSVLDCETGKISRCTKPDEIYSRANLRSQLMTSYTVCDEQRAFSVQSISNQYHDLKSGEKFSMMHGHFEDPGKAFEHAEDSGKRETNAELFDRVKRTKISCAVVGIQIVSPNALSIMFFNGKHTYLQLHSSKDGRYIGEIELDEKILKRGKNLSVLPCSENKKNLLRMISLGKEGFTISSYVLMGVE